MIKAGESFFLLDTGRHAKRFIALTSSDICEGMVVYAMASHYPDVDGPRDVEFCDANAIAAYTLETRLLDNEEFPDAWRGKKPLPTKAVQELLTAALDSGMAKEYKDLVEKQLAHIKREERLSLSYPRQPTPPPW